MKKILFSLLIVASFTAFAQTNNAVVLADGTVASATFLKANTKNIKSQKSYAANAGLPKNLSNYPEFSKGGLVAVTLKNNSYDRVSVAELNTDHQLDPQNPVLFDGALLNDSKILILGDVINKAEVKIIDGKKVLSISSDPKS